MTPEFKTDLFQKKQMLLFADFKMRKFPCQYSGANDYSEIYIRLSKKWITDLEGIKKGKFFISIFWYQYDS